jgi:NADH-quinone oxidoreductase subunit M
MILTWLILIPILGGLASWLTDRWSAVFARWIALGTMSVHLALSVIQWLRFHNSLSITGQGAWLIEFQTDWIPRFGVSYHLALDGLSLMMIVLTSFIGVLAVLISWREIQDRVGLFHAALLIVMGGIVGVFLSLDLFLFYFFWEVMLIPMYFLIGVWGHERRIFAATKFFIFTLASGVLMLVAILGLYFWHGQATGNFTFDYLELLGRPVEGALALWLMLGFLIAFAVKLPTVPFHNWLPDAHTEAPTAGSLILAALLLKTGAYGLIRFVVPLFPEAAKQVAPVVMVLGVFGIVYGAIVAFSQTDLKRLVAYTSVSHMGFVLIGVFAWNELALQGTVMQMICHGLSTGALFALVGMVYERIHTRDLSRMGGLFTVMPRLGGMAIFFAMASLGLPGLGNFVGEFMILFGVYRANIPVAIVATIGVVFATVYSLWIVQRAFFGKQMSEAKLPDLSVRESVVLWAMALGLLWLGLFPQPVFNVTEPVIKSLKPPVTEAVQGEFGHE